MRTSQRHMVCTRVKNSYLYFQLCMPSTPCFHCFCLFRLSQPLREFHLFFAPFLSSQISYLVKLSLHTPRNSKLGMQGASNRIPPRLLLQWSLYTNGSGSENWRPSSLETCLHMRESGAVRKIRSPYCPVFHYRNCVMQCPILPEESIKLKHQASQQQGRQRRGFSQML